MRCWLAVFFVSVAVSLTQGHAQETPPAEVLEHGYADMVVFNGKIVTMDDRTHSATPGWIVEALAVKKGEIIALGSSDRIRRLAGPKTFAVDLKGRTMIPGLVETHSHLYDYAARWNRELGIRAPNPGVAVRAKADRTPEFTQVVINKTVRENLPRVKPGEWIAITMEGNPALGVHDGQPRTWASEKVLTSRKQLDLVAPDNPVIVRAGTRSILNSKALAEAEKALPGYGEFIKESMEDPGTTELGMIGVPERSALSWELWYRASPLSKLAEALRKESEAWAAYGVTTFSTRIPNPTIMSAYNYLNRQGRMPIRLAAHMESHRTPGPVELTLNYYRYTGDLTGLGADHLWITGVASERWDSLFPEVCLGPDAAAPEKIKKRERCPTPNSMPWKVLREAVRMGWRPIGVHGVGSHGIRLFLRLIDEVRKEKGWSAEEARRLRPTFEHCEALVLKDDLIQKLKEYDAILSCAPRYIKTAPLYIRDYGPKIESAIVPLKSLMDAGVRVVGQIDSRDPADVGAFYHLWLAIAREVDGKVITPQERLDRVIALKMWTTWAAEYVGRQGKLGTLEARKLADFVVLDRDYFTIPVGEIRSLRPVMTVLGGKIAFLRKEFASELKMEPVGYQPPPDWPRVK